MGRLFPALLAALSIFVAAPASAHAVLLSTDPADSAVLDQPPARVTLHFNEPVTPVLVRVIAQTTGRPVTAPGDVHAIDQDLVIALPADLPKGGYLVSYRVVSVDSHPVGGAFPFGIGAPAAAAPVATSGHRAIWEAASLALRMLRDLGVLVSAGGVFFLMLVGAPAGSAGAIRYLLVRVSLLTALAIAAGIGVEGAQLADAAPAGIVDPQLWRLGWGTTLGTSAALCGLGVLLVAALPLVRLPVATGGALLAIAGFTVTGHAATAEPVAFMAPAMALHVAAIAYWVGGLWPLGVILRRETASVATPVVIRFARLAVMAVALLVLAGTGLAVVQLGSVAALIDSEYGRILLLKLALVAILLLIAWDNRRRLTPALAEDWARASLRRSIGCEFALVAAILLATGLLGQIVPARAEAGGMVMPMGNRSDIEMNSRSDIVTNGDRKIWISVAPARPGMNQLEIHLMTADGQSFDVQELSVDLSDPAAGIEAIHRVVPKVGDGVYRLGLADFSLPGTWKVAVRALIDDFTLVEFDAELPIR